MPASLTFKLDAQAEQLGTYQLVAAGLPGSQCLVAEYATPCNPGVDSAVCAWHNAAVRGCDVYAAAPLAQHPEDVWVSSAAALSALRWAGAPQVGDTSQGWTFHGGLDCSWPVFYGAPQLGVWSFCVLVLATMTSAT